MWNGGFEAPPARIHLAVVGVAVKRGTAPDTSDARVDFSGPKAFAGAKASEIGSLFVSAVV